MGLAVITTGNHAWDKKEILDFFPQEPRLLRPANYPDGVPGRGSIVAETPGGARLGVLPGIGRACMPTLGWPLRGAAPGGGPPQRRTRALQPGLPAGAPA